MEFKHFSHNHGLVSHLVQQGSQIQCSGCKSPGSGNFYACWQCSYFLHDECFRASRYLKHPSHPLHPLTLVPYPTYPSGSFFCNTCHHGGDGFSYSCSACDFDIHVHCALTPNPNLHVPPSPIPAPNFNSQPQNPFYPPIQTSTAFPTYPPPQTPTIPYDIQNYPPQPQPQPTSYPPVPNCPIPNVSPAFPPNQQIQQNPPPAYPQPNPTPPQNFFPPANAPTTTPPPPPPNPTVPTYSTVVNTTASNPPTTKPPPPQPSVSQPTPSKPPSMIKHFSHPHVLKPMEIDQKNKKVCSACECELSGSAYCCTEPYCTFNLHKSCFDSPREVHHKSHLEHPLTLLSAPPYSDAFTCNACLKDGKAFAYNCSTCSYDLHIDCIQWPDKVTRPDHEHSLTLYYSSPAAEASDVTFMCDACKNPVHEMAWVYYCRECDFGTHLECVTSGIKLQNEGGGKTEEELMKELELNFAVLQILAQGRKYALELI